jgi:hypothetical protein
LHLFAHFPEKKDCLLFLAAPKLGEGGLGRRLCAFALFITPNQPLDNKTPAVYRPIPAKKMFEAGASAWPQTIKHERKN